MRNHFRDKKSPTLSPDWWVFSGNGDARSGRTNSPVSHEMFCEQRERDYGSEDLRFISGTTRLVLPSFAAVVSLIRRSDSFASCFASPPLPRRAGIRSRFLSFFFARVFRLPSRSQEGLDVRRVKGGCDLLAPSVRSTTYGFRRQDSGPALQRSSGEWLETEMDFPGDIRVYLVSEII